jgi:hypothetical protein
MAPPSDPSRVIAAPGEEIATGEAEPPRFLRAKRLGLAIATTLLSLNIWTGAPLFAVWVGSRSVSDSGLSMGAVALVIVVLMASVLGLVTALARVSARYDELTGQAAVRRTAPWMRSMRAERDSVVHRRKVTPLERILVLTVVAAVVGLEVWFFFFAGSSIGHS